MPWWNRPRSPDPARGNPGDATAGQEALASGRLLPRAKARLARQRAGTNPWASTFSAAESLTARSLDLVPIGQVLGSCTLRPTLLSAAVYGWGRSGELPSWSRATSEARATALWRLRLEAEALGAHGVTGVLVNATQPEWGGGLWEFTALGTAVRWSKRPEPDRLFLGTLSTVETAALFSAGYRPVDLVFATTVYYVATSLEAQWAQASFANTEIPDFTQAIYAARNLVVSRLTEQAAEVQAEGVLAARWSMAVEEVEVEGPSLGAGVGPRQDHILTLTVMGTAVARDTGNRPRRPTPLLPLADTKKGAVAP